MAELFNEPQNEDGRYIYSVSELTREIKVLLETTIPMIWVEGEISNFKLHFHLFFVNSSVIAG